LSIWSAGARSGLAGIKDAVCAASAEAAGCEAIVTQDPAGFPDSPLPIVDPAAALGLIAAH
jgi:hypothetical protein